MPSASTSLQSAFVTLSLLVAAALPALIYVADRRTGLPRAAARRRAVAAAAASAAWMTLTATLAAAGWLRFAPPPRTILLVIAATFVLAFAVGLSSLGGRIAAGAPLALLVGVQGFRLPLELLLHRAYVEGLMPVQMSYSGRNFDIVTGTTALLLAAWAARGRVPLWAFTLWNALGVALLANIVTVALLSAPTPLRVFHNEPANVWITRAPWVWLPAVMVGTAVLGHILVFRHLKLERARQLTPRDRDGAADRPTTRGAPASNA